jgi:hypothetical protein
MSRYGEWVEEAGLPVFSYRGDPRSMPEAEWDPVVTPPTRRHFVAIGNRRIQAIVDNEGGICVFDEHEGLRFIVAPDPGGSGHSIVEPAGEPPFGTGIGLWPAVAPERRFGPTFFTVSASSSEWELERTVLCPEGEHPFVLVRVRLRNGSAGPRRARLVEVWQLRPRFLTVFSDGEMRRQAAEAVGFRVSATARGLLAEERRGEEAAQLSATVPARLFGRPLRVVLEAVDDLPVESPDPTGLAGAGDVGAAPGHPELSLGLAVELGPGETLERTFRFGVDEEGPAGPAPTLEASLAALRARLPRATSSLAPMATREVPWHAALLTGGACRDAVLGGHTLDQASAYSFVLGFNGAARDPFQHALPLVYTEPDLALSVLRNTCSWGGPDGELPWALDGAKQPWTAAFQPSDQPLWALWLAAEYAAATGDLEAFSAPVPFHPASPGSAGRAGELPLSEHLRRQFRFFIDVVGRGERGHVRMRNADWNDMASRLPDVDRRLVIERGESVLNSAMAAWVLPVFAGLAARVGLADEAAEANSVAGELRALVAGEWNGSWFRRAYAPGVVVGDSDLWLEVQPWAVLSGAASREQSQSVLATIDERLRAGSPLGARLKWPVPDEGPDGRRGEGTAGGIWFSIVMTLVWAAGRVDSQLALDEWRRMTLAAHTEAYPVVWEGTLSGPDCYNSPESARPGRTWISRELRAAMQSFPVNNLHSHCQPLFSWLRLLGVEPTASGSLSVVADGRAGPGGVGSFSSRTFELREDGSGRLTAGGPVRIETVGGAVSGGPGEVSW